MTREEYDALIKEQARIESELEDLVTTAYGILSSMEIAHNGSIEVHPIRGDLAAIRYRLPGCSCCPDYETKEVPAAWFFGADYAAEIEQKKLSKTGDPS